MKTKFMALSLAVGLSFLGTTEIFAQKVVPKGSGSVYEEAFSDTKETTAAEPEQWCYRCMDSGQGYFDCWYPYSSGNKTCIPQQYNCVVGTWCGQQFGSLRLTPDGSILAEVVSPMLAATEAVRDCKGLIVARSYSEDDRTRIQTETSRLSI